MAWFVEGDSPYKASFVVRRSITHVLPDDKLVPVKLEGEDAFGCSEVLLPESFLDKYLIGKQLGSGFSGVVFAVSPRLPQDLAVKIINKAMLEPDRVCPPRWWHSLLIGFHNVLVVVLLVSHLAPPSAWSP